ncbi:hypothetical protein EJ08DRAFT_686167 [Tothia fuscella]|uniref:PCI domain-containing protein n=1 Tax=Tothia fuscella TaxID=1048955 RepID=A0A9P4NXZ9_9PEZI|nr:hypothetical protein EJ08DRAFT_686167 [Tothia fuscella]
MDVETIPDLLEQQRDAAPEELQHYFLDFTDFWERKLWHELTDSIMLYFDEPASKPQRRELYDTFIVKFADKINKLKLVHLGLAASLQCKNQDEVLSMKKALAEKVNKPASQDAYVFAQVAVASTLMTRKDLPAARKILDECEGILENFDSVETVVHASFYRENATYFQLTRNFAAYYKNALLFLACVEVDMLLPSERQSRAIDLSVAALVSDQIYNFGELLLHPILDSLKDTDNAWLRDLLFAFNRGDLAAYDVLVGNISKAPDLKEFETLLYQKVCLAALTETVFKRPPHDRAMSFQTISRETKVRDDEIEHLIMKALSLGLLKGTIDQVAEVAKINWVQPKVLDMTQVGNMRTRLREWDSSVNQLGNWIEGVGKDVWAA